MESRQHKKSEVLKNERTTAMYEVERCFKFTHEITGQSGEIAKLTADYAVTLTYRKSSERVFILIKPDFGPRHEMTVHDCGVTWKSIFQAYRWCARHAQNHLMDWVEMDEFEQPGMFGCLFAGTPVIPVSKLSTPCPEKNSV
jgi:hypothetical protein